MKSNTYLDVILIFYLITVIILTALCYLIIYDGAYQTQQIKSIDLYSDVLNHVTDNIINDSHSLEHLLASHIDGDVSYQMMIVTPFQRPYIHQFIRDDQQDLDFFILPYWQNETEKYSYQLHNDQLLGYIDLGKNKHIYLQAFYPPIAIDYTRMFYWLPLLTALVLISFAMLLSHRRLLDWQSLMDYMDELPNRVYEPYSPVHFKEIMNGHQFVRLGNALNRINYQLHHSHRRLQIIQTRLEHLIEQAPLPIFLIKRNGQISFFNKRFEKLFMTSFEESINYYLSDFLVGVDKDNQLALANLDSERKSRIINVTSLEQNGTPYQLHLAPWFSKQGQVQGYCATLSDITTFTTIIANARNKLTLQQNKLNEFDKLWSVLGHELRTPLSGILGMLDLMDRDNFTIDQQETFNTIEMTGKGMLLMLNDMLDIAKIDAGKLQLINERTDLLDLLKQLVDLMSGSARQQKIELLSRFDPQCPRYFTTDAGRLRQALMNLLSNAIKFTQSGYVALSVNHHHRDDEFMQSVLQDNNHKNLDPALRWLCFIIEDTGIGISERDQQKLFSHFNQANESISRQFGGTGLGLAISNNFAQLLGGFIHVDSEVGVGSRFSLCLPNYETSYQPLYQFNADLSHLLLIAFTSQDISTKAFYELSNHLDFAATIHTRIDNASITKINHQDSIHLKPVILVEYELYDTDNISLLDDLDIAKDTPKILLSMTPENAISDDILHDYSAVLTKPLNVSQLVAELIRLANYEGQGSRSINRTLKASGSQVQQSFEDFMNNLKSDNTQLQDTNQISIEASDDTDHIKDPADKSKASEHLILVAEDNIINQKVVTKILKKLGYSSLIAQNGQEVLDYVVTKDENIALILMDCRMPVINGLEATRQIRAMKNSIPIVALTANDTDSDREECLQVGMNGFLAKPIKEKSLDKVLKKFLAS